MYLLAELQNEPWVSWSEGGSDHCDYVLYGQEQDWVSLTNLTKLKSRTLCLRTSKDFTWAYAEMSPCSRFIAVRGYRLGKPQEVRVLATEEMVSNKNLDKDYECLYQDRFEADDFQWQTDGKLNILGCWEEVRATDKWPLRYLPDGEVEALWVMLENPDTGIKYQDVFGLEAFDVAYDPVGRVVLECE